MKDVNSNLNAGGQVASTAAPANLGAIAPSPCSRWRRRFWTDAAITPKPPKHICWNDYVATRSFLKL
jgi:hypothetical protein